MVLVLVGSIAFLAHAVFTAYNYIWGSTVRDVSPYHPQQRTWWMQLVDILVAIVSITGSLVVVLGGPIFGVIGIVGTGWLLYRLAVNYVTSAPATDAVQTRPAAPQLVERKPSRLVVARVTAPTPTKAESKLLVAASRQNSASELPPPTQTTNDPEMLPERDTAPSPVSSHDWSVEEAPSERSAPSLDEPPTERPPSLSSLAVVAPSIAEPLFVPEDVPTGLRERRLTVEDVYIEAMTLDAEIRVFRRRLNATGRRELSRIISFCRDALHRKLLLRSVEQAQQRNVGQPRRSASTENLTTTDLDAEQPANLELIAETAV